MNSRLYEGRVNHARTTPRRNAFSYKVYFGYFDLSELDELDTALRRFSHNGRALIAFHDADHGPRDGSPLRPWIDALLARAGVDLEGGPVRILTIPRVLGEVFYPVAFWYCFHRDGTTRAVLAEVQNTYRDHHSYLLHDRGRPLDWNATPTAAKAFYVSPFVRRENVVHEFHFTEPGEHVTVRVDDRVDDAILLTTTLSLDARPLTDESLLRVVGRLGPMSARALVLIHWQALKLLLKRVPYFDHTPPPGEEVTL